MVVRVAQLVTTLARGGAQATVLASSVGGDDQLDVTVLAGPDDPGEGTYWAEVGQRGIPAVVVPSLHRSVNLRSDAAALRWLVQWLKRARPDVVHTHSGKAGALGRIAASRAGLPVVHTVHGWTSASFIDGPLAPLRQRAVVELERRLARRSEALVVVTAMDAEEGLRQRIGCAEQYRVIRSGIGLDAPRAGASRRAELRRRLGLDRRFVVGTVGRLADQKDLTTLVSGFASAGLDDGQLVIIGDGPGRLELQRRIRALGLSDRVLLLGHRPDAAELVGAFDVFVSTARWEGLPRTLIEAMAAEVPVIATPVGGVPEVVQHGITGLVVPVGDPQAVASALRERARHPERARRMACAASAQVAAFSEERMRADLLCLWHEMAGRQPRRPGP